MSILKSILHHYNKVTKSYDTLHPETESAQITDWHSGIMASLASKTLGTVVDAITTDSVLGKLIKMLLDASGVKYLIDTNGYVCFGSLFGGLIIQWGMPTIGDTTYYADYQLPISMPHKVLMVVCSDLVGGGPSTTATMWKTCWNVTDNTKTSVRIIAESKDASSIAAVIIGY